MLPQIKSDVYIKVEFRHCLHIHEAVHIVVPFFYIADCSMVYYKDIIPL